MTSKSTGALQGTIADTIENFIYANTNITNLNNITLETILPQLEEALSPFGINATAVLMQIFNGAVPDLSLGLDQVLQQFVTILEDVFTINREYLGSLYVSSHLQ